MVPDTYDVQERARLVIHALTESTDPLADYEPYYCAHFRTNPPVMVHSSWHGATFGKFIEAVALARIISGSDQNAHIEQKWMEVALKCQGADGLFYTPTRGRPWHYWEVSIGQHNRESPIGTAKVETDQLLSPFGNGRMLSTFSLYAMRDGGPLWRNATRRMVDGLIELANERGDIAFFWPYIDLATKESPPDDVDPSHSGIDGYSHVVHGMVHAHRLLNYEPGLELAQKFVTYMRRYFFEPDGSFLCGPGNPAKAHFHCHSNALLSMLQFGRAVADDELIEFVATAYERAKKYVQNYRWEDLRTVSTPGANLLGYFPELVNSDEWEGSELCEVSDMIGLALKMSEAGIADCWDDADRWIRNMFAEGQLLSTDWIYNLPTAGLVNPRPQALAPSFVDSYSTTEHVPERNLGAFAGWPAANDWFVGNGSGIMHCCTVNSARALYWIWDGCVRYNSGQFRVNLLLNRTSPWADIDSHIPYKGQVDVKVKKRIDLSIRIPEWVKSNEAICKVNNKSHQLSWGGRFALIGNVMPDDVVSLHFPISERDEVVHVEKQRFNLVIKGNDVVSIDPPGRYGPLYQRIHYRSDATRWRETQRFLSEEQFRW